MHCSQFLKLFVKININNATRIFMIIHVQELLIVRFAHYYKLWAVYSRIKRNHVLSRQINRRSVYNVHLRLL